MEERPTIFVDVDLSGEGAPDTLAIYGLRGDLADLGFTLPPLGDFAIPIPDADVAIYLAQTVSGAVVSQIVAAVFKRFGRKRDKNTGKPATTEPARPTIVVIYGPDRKVLRRVEVRAEGT